MIEIPGFRILRQLGRGGMATVYLALQESVERQVALKVMSRALLVDPEFGERFLLEAKVAARLHHRNVVGIHDVGSADGHLFIAMEYLGGGPVVEKGTACTREFALRVTREIAGALGYAHARGIVHRDVKPDNILLREDGSAVLTDFGIARATGAAVRKTRTGAIIGTPHYMSPEQARGRPVDGRADLYSLGIVLHELLLGRVPYDAEDSLAVGILHVTEPVPVLPSPFESLQPLLSKLLAKAPEDRFQTGEEVAAAIESLEVGRQPATPVAAPPGDSLPAMSARDDRGPIAHAIAGAGGHERAEPRLGAIDSVVLAGDRQGRVPGIRGAGSFRRQAPRRGLALLVIAALALAAGVLAYRYQDRLRALLPRTELNATLERARQALAAGRLTGHDGSSAAELFASVEAQDPDNDAARQGLASVGNVLLARAKAAFERHDLGDARTDLDAARPLLGGGAAIEALEHQITAARSDETRIVSLLDDAQRALMSGKITGSDGAAALYREVLATDKANAIANAGLVKCADALATKAHDALATGDTMAAEARTQEIAAFLPAYPGLPDLRGRIAQAAADAASARDAKLDAADDALRAGRIIDAPDSALDLYRAVLAEDPGSARAKAGIDAVAKAIVAQAGRAIDDSNAPAAAKLLDRAQQLAPGLPAISAARQRLKALSDRLAMAAQVATLTPADHRKVARLVAEGAAAAEAGRLIVPPGDSAFDKYRAALAIDGNDSAALEGMAALAVRARDLFAQALADNRPFQAREYLDALRQFTPDDPGLPALGERLAGAMLDAAAARIGEGRRADAARLLDAAHALSPANPRWAGLEARMQRMPGPRDAG